MPDLHHSGDKPLSATSRSKWTTVPARSASAHDPVLFFDLAFRPTLTAPAHLMAADESACTADSVVAPSGLDRRPSISACRRRQALAAYPQASDGPPSSACASHPRVALLGLAPGGVYLAIPVSRN